MALAAPAPAATDTAVALTRASMRVRLLVTTDKPPAATTGWVSSSLADTSAAILFMATTGAIVNALCPSPGLALALTATAEPEISA